MAAEQEFMAIRAHSRMTRVDASHLAGVASEPPGGRDRRRRSRDALTRQIRRN